MRNIRCRYFLITWTWEFSIFGLHLCIFIKLITAHSGLTKFFDIEARLQSVILNFICASHSPVQVHWCAAPLGSKSELPKSVTPEVGDHDLDAISLTHKYHRMLHTTFLLSLGGICRLCNEVDWILLASLRKLLSSVCWWCRSYKFSSLGVISLWPEFRKVRYREGTLGGPGCHQWLPDLCQKQVSQHSMSLGSHPLWCLRLWKERMAGSGL